MGVGPLSRVLTCAHTLERMSETPPPDRLQMLHFTRRVVEKQAREQLAQIDRWIEAEERRRQEQANAAARRPPPPDYLIEMGLTGRAAVYVHSGDCHMAGKRSKPINAGQARDALGQEKVPACTHCRPDTALGVLE